MKIPVSLLFALLLFAIVSCQSEKQNEKELHLTGKVENNAADTIYLIGINQDTRFDSLIKLPVTNGTFEYTKKLDQPKAFQLAYAAQVNSGSYRYMPVFLENEEIKLTVYPEEEFDRNTVSGGTYNQEYKTYKQEYENKFNAQLEPLEDSLRLLYENHNYHSEEATKLYDKLRDAQTQDEKIPVYNQLEELQKNNQHLSPAAAALENKINPIYKSQKQFKDSYIEEHPTLVSYYLFLQDLINDKESIDVNLAKSNYKALSKANAQHPYNELAANLIDALKQIKLGKEYIDFSAPALSGQQVKLSDSITGQLALLDLWATWCGPCIARSRTMVPLYKEYKDKGFTIVGVAGEFKNTNRLKEFQQKEKWPWLQLVELDRQNNVWQKYGVGNGGGALFLIDKQGKIIAKDPTADEVRQELETRLN